MKHIHLQSILGRIAVLLTLAGSLTMTMVYAGEASADKLSPGEILDKVRANYASLVTYSDEGTVVVSVNGNVTTTTFDIRLARSNFYRVRWIQTGDSSTPILNAHVESVWSSGAGDHLQADYGLEDEDSPEIALGMASTLSDGTTADLPLIFFNLPLGDAQGDSAYSEKRQPDEPVGKVDCYVVTRILLLQRKTFWVGKRDFLIHQIQTITGVDAPVLPDGELNWQTMLSLHLIVFTETHGNILVNQSLQRSDFVP
jgi:hypothetical protein